MSNNKSFRATAGFFSDNEPTKEEAAIAPEPVTDPIPEIMQNQVPKGYRIVKESKTARVQLLLTPTLKQDLQRMAKEKNVSFNELCNMALIQYADAETGA